MRNQEVKSTPFTLSVRLLYARIHNTELRYEEQTSNRGVERGLVYTMLSDVLSCLPDSLIYGRQSNPSNLGVRTMQMNFQFYCCTTKHTHFAGKGKTSCMYIPIFSTSLIPSSIKFPKQIHHAD